MTPQVPERSVPQTNLQVRLGSSIRHYRQRLGLTQEELAWRANLHRTYITDVERGARNITLRTIGQLARALEVPIEALVIETLDATDSTELVELGEILLVEDSPTDAAMTSRALRRSQFRNPVRVAGDGEEALQLLGLAEPAPRAGVPRLPHLVLLDLHLPKVDGLALLGRIRADRRTAELPVAVLTISDEDRMIQACRDLGVEHYIIKPVTPEALSRVILAARLGWALMPSAGATTNGVGTTGG